MPQLLLLELELVEGDLGKKRGDLLVEQVDTLVVEGINLSLLLLVEAGPDEAKDEGNDGESHRREPAEEERGAKDGTDKL